jgi:hypothetical protein
LEYTQHGIASQEPGTKYQALGAAVQRRKEIARCTLHVLKGTLWRMISFTMCVLEVSNRQNVLRGLCMRALVSSLLASIHAITSN